MVAASGCSRGDASATRNPIDTLGLASDWDISLLKLIEILPCQRLADQEFCSERLFKMNLLYRNQDAFVISFINLIPTLPLGTSRSVGRLIPVDDGQIAFSSQKVFEYLGGLKNPSLDHDLRRNIMDLRVLLLGD